MTTTGLHWLPVKADTPALAEASDVLNPFLDDISTNQNSETVTKKSPERNDESDTEKNDVDEANNIISAENPNPLESDQSGQDSDDDAGKEGGDEAEGLQTDDLSCTEGDGDGMSTRMGSTSNPGANP